MCSRNTSDGSLPAEVVVDPRLVLEVAVDAVEVERDPADAALGQRDLEVGELAQRRAEQQVLRGEHRDLRRDHDDVVDRRFGGQLDEVAAGADVQRTAPCSRRRGPASIGSQWPDRKLGKPCACGASRKLIARQPFLAMRLTSATARSTSHIGTMPSGMKRPGYARAPLVDVPVVVGLEHDQRQLLVAGLGERAGVEAGHRGEAHRREHAVDVHVAHALVHVEAAGPQLGERARVEAPLLARPADGRRHAERRRGALALEHPLVDALRVADDLRHLVEPLGRDVVLVHVGWLDHVVVDADQDHVFCTHCVVPLS